MEEGGMVKWSARGRKGTSRKGPSGTEERGCGDEPGSSSQHGDGNREPRLRLGKHGVVVDLAVV